MMGRREVERWRCDACGKEEITYPGGRPRGWWEVDYGSQWPGMEMKHVGFVMCSLLCYWKWAQGLAESIGNMLEPGEREAVDGKGEDGERA